MMPHRDRSVIGWWFYYMSNTGFTLALRLTKQGGSVIICMGQQHIKNWKGKEVMMHAQIFLACINHHDRRVNRGENSQRKGWHDSSGRARSFGLLCGRERRDVLRDVPRLASVGDRQHSVDGAGDLANRLRRSPLLREQRGYGFCASREGTASPWDRFYRGEGTSVGFKFGSVAIAIVIAIGAYGLNQTPGSQMPWLARDIIVLVSLVVCLIIRAVDAQNYGTENYGPRSSADGIAKVYHDLMINGVLLAVQAMTWVYFILVTIVNWILGEPTHWLLVVAIAVVWVIYFIIAIVKRGPLNYAKLHPEDPEWWND